MSHHQVRAIFSFPPRKCTRFVMSLKWPRRLKAEPFHIRNTFLDLFRH